MKMIFIYNYTLKDWKKQGAGNSPNNNSKHETDKAHLMYKAIP